MFTQTDAKLKEGITDGGLNYYEKEENSNDMVVGKEGRKSRKRKIN